MKNLLFNVLLFMPFIIYLIIYRKDIPFINGSIELISAELIVLSIFLVLGAITSYSINKNNELYEHFKGQVAGITKNSEGNLLAQSILQGYLNEKTSSGSQLNLPSFIETYMAEYRMNDKRPVIGTLQLIQAFASISILIGVLGTFIGLVMSLGGIDPEKMVNSISTIFDGIHTAFYTSIAGIIYSIVINLHLKTKNTEHLLLQTMLKVENYIHKKDKETADFYVVEAIGKVQESVEQMNKTFVEVAQFSKEFKVATQNMNKFNETFQTSTSSLKDVFGNIEIVTGLFNDRSTQIHDDFGKLFDYFNGQKNSTLAIQTAFEKTSRDINSSVKQQEKHMIELLEGNRELKEQSKALIEATETKIQSAQEGLSKFFGEVSGGFIKLLEQNSSQINSNTILTETVYRQIKEEQEILMKTIEAALEQKKELEVLIKELLLDRKMPKKANLTNNITSGSSEKQMNELNQLIKEMNGIFEKQSKDQQLYDLTSLNSTLSELKKLMEALNDKLQQVEVQVS